MADEKVNIPQKFAQLSELWSPKIVGELNGQHVKLAKLKGEFDWHHHEDEDEMFFVLKGELDLHLHGGEVVHLDPGEFYIVRKGIEHKPIARSECHIMLFEPAGTRNTGNIDNERTVEDPERI